MQEAREASADYSQIAPEALQNLKHLQVVLEESLRLHTTRLLVSHEPFLVHGSTASTSRKTYVQTHFHFNRMPFSSIRDLRAHYILIHHH